MADETGTREGRRSGSRDVSELTEPLRARTIWASHGGRAVCLAAVVCLGIPSVSAQARAVTDTENTTSPYSNSYITCSGELVTVEGERHTVRHSTVDADGGGHSFEHRNLQGVSGESESGVPYRQVGAGTGSPGDYDHFNGRADGAREYTFVRNEGLISQGPSDNSQLHVVEHQTYNAKGELAADVFHVVSRCGG